MFFTERLARRLPFFYGYVMLPVAMAMQIGTSPGQTFAVSAFTPALLSELQLSEGRLALAYMIGTLCAAVPLSVVGPISDQWGLRRTSLTVIVLLAVACGFASMVKGFSGLLLVFFLLRFLGQGSLTLLAGNATSMWFRKRIGRVSALISIGTAIAFAYVPSLLAASIEARGFRLTYQVIAVTLAVALLPAVWLLFCNRPEDVGQVVDGDQPVAAGETDSIAEDEPSATLRDAIRTKSYFVIGLTSATWAMIGTGLVFYLFTLCSDRGFATGTAADVMKTFGLTMLAFQFFGGFAADRVKLSRLLGTGAVLLTAGIGLIGVAHTSIMMHGFAFLFGGGQGMLIAVTSVIWVRFYGRSHLGSIRGAVWCATVAGSGCGPLIMGSVKDQYRTYDPAIWVFAAMMAPLAIAAWMIVPPALNTADSRSS
ncbi:MAG: MFS transporter [Planctomycetota bacterium]